MTAADQIVLTDLKTYREYFEGLATKAKFLNYFAYTGDEFEKDSSNPARTGWVMILEPYKVPVRDNQADNVMGSPEGMFIIAKKKTRDILKFWEIEEQAEVYARKIIGVMRKNVRDGKLLTTLENFRYEPIDPMAVAEYFGIVVTFNFQFPLNKALKYDAADWSVEP